MRNYKARRWSDHDKYWGPITYAQEKGRTWRPIAAVLSSMDDEDEGAFNSLRFSAFGHTLIFTIPQIVKPWRQWVDTSKYEWSNNPAGGYWDQHQRQYGFSVSDGFLQVFFGAQTHDSQTDQNWGWFLPWKQWRHVRHSFYGLSGEHIADEPRRKRGATIDDIREHLSAGEGIENSVPTRSFAFLDYDGEKLTARTKIEEREWRLGEGWFKWLSLFRRPKVRRSLDIWFSGETGRRKGSWKGGTMGHGVDMKPGELHEAAFKRYCAEHQMTFVGAAEE